MSEYLTPANLAIAISLFASIYAVLKTIAPQTKTTVDDDIVSFIDKGRAWVQSYGFPIWSVVEQLEKAGKIQRLSKYGEYMSIFREAFKSAFGKEMPEELETDAELMAKGLSAADKLAKEVSANPTQGLDAAK